MIDDASPKSQPFSTLSPHHYAMLHEESAIAPEVIAARGYRTMTSGAALATLGFAGYQRRAPALVLPVHDVHGTVVLSQIRPDHPRRNKRKKLIKYETPDGAKVRLDIHPLHRERLTRPEIPLIITEGLRKADSLVSASLSEHQICVWGLIGVHGWMREGKPLPDWRAVALKGRRVVVVFDSDAAETPEVAKARASLAQYLADQGAHVQLVDLPPLATGKCGADDFLLTHTLDDLLALAQDCRTAHPTLLTHCAASVTPEPVQWLWEPYLALGTLCMLDGDPGVGKSLLITQLAANISKGHPFPDQTGKPTVGKREPANVLILTREDSLSMTIRPRLDASGADVHRVFISATWLDAEGKEQSFTLKHLPLLEAELERLRLRLVVLDPIQGAVYVSRESL